MSNYTTITESATVIDADGYISNQGVAVCDHGETISIGSCEYNKSELSIDIDNRSIAPSFAGWSVSW